MSLRVAVVSFPGSNCDQDVIRALRLVGMTPVPVWHANALEGQLDAVIVPGGFSYGDYVRCGVLARFSVAMRSVADFARSGRPVAGVCNGFQILCEAGLLPGALRRNAGIKFRCRWTTLRVESTATPFTQAYDAGQTIRIPIAHGEGNYIDSNDALARLEDRGQVVFRYVGENPNGSARSIAGVCNEARNVVGLMPHPERAMEALLGGEDGQAFFESLRRTLAVA